MKYLIIPDKIVTNNSSDDIISSGGIVVEENLITAVLQNITDELIDAFEGEVLSFPNKILIPGFVQTHIHLCQTLFRGMADDLELLDWLQQRIFPFENSHTAETLCVSSQLGLYELQMGGTTSILDMGTLRHQEVIFQEFHKSFMRGAAGKCLIDINGLYPEFRSDRKSEINESVRLADAFHNSANGRVKYAFAPRFALSCSEDLLRECSELVKSYSGSILHTHASENKNEIAEVRRMYGKDNIAFLQSVGLTGKNSVFAHCVHCNDEEIAILKSDNVHVAHCPSSNLKLASGIAPVVRYLKEGINVSIGADGAPCNNSLSAFNEMRLAGLIQKPLNGPRVLSAKTIFKMATISGAKALGLESEIGSIEAGKKADLVLLDLSEPGQPIYNNDGSIYSSIVYSSTASSVTDVMIDGNWVVKNRCHQIYDKNELLYSARKSLEKIISY